MYTRAKPLRISAMTFAVFALSGLFFSMSPATADVRGDVEAKLVDTQKRAAPDLTVGKARCASALAKPAGRVAAGVYRCTVAVEGVSVPYNVTVRTGGVGKTGTYTMQSAGAVIDTKKLIAIAASVVDDPTKAQISCGKARVVVAAPGTMLVCSVVDGGATQTLTFAVKDLRGVVSLVR